MLQSIRIPFLNGRVMYVPAKHDAILTADALFATNLKANHIRNGKIIEKYDLGSGLTTNIYAALIASLFVGQLSSTANFLNTFNFHGSGVGVTAAAATDYQLQTAITGTPTTGTAGTIVNSSIAGTAKTTFSATIAYGSNNAVTEWGLFNSATYIATTGSPATATTATTLTSTGATLSANAFVGFILVTPQTSSTNLGIIASNTTSAFTLLTPTNGWLAIPNDATAGTTPVSNVAYNIQPAMLDRKEFLPINVVGGADSIQFIYTLTSNSGG